MEILSQSDNFKKSSRRFKWAMRLNSELVAQKPQVTGWENLKKIPKGVNPVIAGSHLRTDASIQIIAGELAGKFNLGIAVQAGNRKEPLINGLFTLIGQDNFYDIDSLTERKEVNGRRVRIDKYKLNLNNYEVMRNAMEKGKTILVAAHWSPIYNGILPDKPGFAAVYLAHLSGQRVVLPVALDILTDNEDIGRIDRLSNIVKNLLTGNRPKSKMTICEPIALDSIDSSSIELMREWLAAKSAQRSSGLSLENQKRAMEAQGKIRRDSERVMYALARALPLEKRGIWNKK